MGYVYKITNTVNNKSYIGISIHEPTQGRIKKHLSGRGNRLLAYAVKKYGQDAFTHEILTANVFDEFLPDLEVAYIANFNTVAPHGYNLDSGGSHAIPSAETRRKMSEIMKNRRTGEKHPSFGKKLSEAHRRKLLDSRKGKPISEDHKRRISEANRGKKHTEETLQRLSEANIGKTLSGETRQKISEKLTGRKRSKEHAQKLSEANRHPDYKRAHSYFFSLSPEMSLREKRQLMYSKFPNISGRAIRKWIQRWTKTPPVSST